MKSLSIISTDLAGLKSRVEGSISHEFLPNVAIVFCSTKFDLDQLIAVFASFHIDLIGCTTAGEIVDDGMFEDAIAVLLLEMPAGHFLISEASYDESGVLQAAEILGHTAQTAFAQPAMVILSGGLTIDAEQIIEGLKLGVGRSIPIYGGLAGDDLNLINTAVFTKNGYSTNALVAMILDEARISVQGLATSGWEPIGGENVISASAGNIVYEINGERAYDVFMKYFGLDQERNTIHDPLITLQTNYPLQLIRENGKTVLRSPMQLDPELGAITLTASVKKGDKFRFSYSPGFEVIDETIKQFDEFNCSVPEADALILFSCKGRHGAFGPLLEHEIRGIYQNWSKPMIGFLTYGEFGNIQAGACEFHNETCSLVILKELE
ncbi:MAG TPA: FIST N-terminal domain-containing protein [Saprospiraceae bacterium]|nr:FIST N-terminal domain-containing protein [Saprospiraceae bacterium]HMQ82658.1 FIST N-terminal domain-containing protein [Saprospiraceae bacterium]